MPRKKEPKKISLAPISAARTPSAALRAATKEIAQFQNTGYRRPDGPTPERLLRADGGVTVEIFTEVVEIARGDKFEAVPVDLVRMRADCSPLARLRRQKLISEPLYLAGERLYADWYKAGLSTLRSANLAGPGGGGFGPRMMFASESQACAAQAFWDALDAVPDEEDFRLVLRAVVLEEKSTMEAGRVVLKIQGEKQAAATAGYVLRLCLRNLAYHYGFLTRAGVEVAP